MNSLNHPYIFAIIMFFAGVGIPIGATLSGSLGSKIHNPVLAAVVLFALGFFVSVLIFVFTQGLPKLSDFNVAGGIPVKYFLGGLFVFFYVITITLIGPRFGIGNAVAFVLLGQLVSMTIIDHFGLFSALTFPITPRRIIGLVLMALAVFLVVKKN